VGRRERGEKSKVGCFKKQTASTKKKKGGERFLIWVPSGHKNGRKETFFMLKKKKHAHRGGGGWYPICEASNGGRKKKSYQLTNKQTINEEKRRWFGPGTRGFSKKLNQQNPRLLQTGPGVGKKVKKKNNGGDKKTQAMAGVGGDNWGGSQR